MEDDTHRSVGYRHTQVAACTAVALAAGVIAQLGALSRALRDGRRRAWGALPGVLGTASAMLLLSSLTVQVDGRAVEVWFTGRLVRRRFPLGSIAHARIVTVPWWYGWGIRLTPRGRLYRVWGRRAVELALAGGSTIAIGSDQPHLLLNAVQAALGAKTATAPEGVPHPAR